MLKKNIDIDVYLFSLKQNSASITNLQKSFPIFTIAVFPLKKFK